jgi:putative tricarboxylic transport membrane protein
MGLVLGGLIETSLAQSMIIFDQDWTGFLTRPVAVVFFALALVGLIGAPLRRAWRKRRV